ncbi:hypothetical protein KT99_03322 [Shewanella benthica KT99]|uniref:Uncharacterized protein n=1 Tax=Shewanella benthica KT99 TaxID=314608 RepID=A9EJY7_9GAMM|nr:hypothetical protein KT99_03322 [Shewanella benthica KT99]
MEDSYEIKSRRLAEPCQNKECTTLAGQALDYNEGLIFNYTFKYQRHWIPAQKIYRNDEK